jgi:hypothetical protein
VGGALACDAHAYALPLAAMFRAASRLLRSAGPAVALSVSASVGLATVAAADEAEHGLHAGAYPWPHEGAFSSYDHASIRRGHQVRVGCGVAPAWRAIARLQTHTPRAQP